jgi:hypothetical protein
MDVMSLVPRLRRAIDGPAADAEGAPTATLTDAQIIQMAADAVADIIFYSNARWPYKLSPLAQGGESDNYGVPTKWQIDPDLPIEQQTIVIAQAALNFFFHQFKTVKIQEEISDESRTWRYSLSANLLLEQMKMLRQQRDDALALIGGDDTFETWVSFIEVRDAVTSAYIEPWVQGDAALLPAGQEYPPDFRCR